MEISLRKAIKDEILSSEIPDLLGGPEKIFYRSATRDTDFPYLCFNIFLQAELGEHQYMRQGELIFDVWDMAETADRTILIARIIQRLFDRGHVQCDGALAVRLFFGSTQDAAIENNRSNRRSEDENLWRREVSFDIRGWDVEISRPDVTTEFPSDFFDLNYSKYFVSSLIPVEPPDGSRVVFTLPKSLKHLDNYTVNGVYFEGTLLTPYAVQVPSAPASGTNVRFNGMLLD